MVRTPTAMSLESHRSIHYDNYCKIRMKRDYTALAAVTILMICAIVTYFGRIYFPENFHPETVSFFENYWVLTFGLCSVVALISISLLGLWWVGSELVKDVKSLLP